MKLTGSEILMECLLREGVDVMFGYPGGAILPTYDAMTKYPQIHHVLVRARAGRLAHGGWLCPRDGARGRGDCDQWPGCDQPRYRHGYRDDGLFAIVCITGQVGRAAIGSDAFQETDVTGVSLPVTKHNYLVMTLTSWPGSCARPFTLPAAAVRGRC